MGVCAFPVSSPLSPFPLSFLLAFSLFPFLSSFPLLLILSNQAILALIAAILAIPEPTDTLCLAYPWFLGIGFMLVFGYIPFHSIVSTFVFAFNISYVLIPLFSFSCLFLRTWALFQVFRAAEQMKKTNLNPIFIMRILGLFLLAEFVSLSPSHLYLLLIFYHIPNSPNTPYSHLYFHFYPMRYC